MTPDRTDSAARRHFDCLSPEERVRAIRRMAAEGQGVYVMASATGLSVEAIRSILRGEYGASRGCP
jgi:hypothetical protein